jgi:glycine cleavage system aminomethyltransferase T
MGGADRRGAEGARRGARGGLRPSPASADFPHLSVAETTFDGHRLRIQRVSFTGELSYEIAIAAPQAGMLADRLWEAGQAFGMVPFGLEALDILRIEKGFIHVGTDTDGATIPADIGWGKPGQREGDYLGKRSLLHPSATKAGRRQLVGLEPLERQEPLSWVPMSWAARRIPARASSPAVAPAPRSTVRSRWGCLPTGASAMAKR